MTLATPTTASGDPTATTSRSSERDRRDGGPDEVRSVLAALVVAFAWSDSVLTQRAERGPQSGHGPKDRGGLPGQRTLMQQYSWASRTEVIDQGQVKDIRIDAGNYGPGGQVQRTIMNDQSAPRPFGFLRRRIAEIERKQVEQY